MWYIKLKLVWDPDCKVVVARGKGMGVGGRGGLIYDKRCFNYRRWEHSATSRSSTVEMYTGNLSDPTGQCHPNKFNESYFY